MTVRVPQFGINVVSMRAHPVRRMSTSQLEHEIERKDAQILRDMVPRARDRPISALLSLRSEPPLQRKTTQLHAVVM